MLVMMNWLIWNCRGAGKKNFVSFVKDCTRIYNLGFVAILEPRIGNFRADQVIKRLGFECVVKADPVGYSGGIWCCWKPSVISIRVINVSRHCIHLHVDPNNQGGWFMSIIYAHPQESLRLSLWEELKSYKNQLQGPWCAAGDFNSISCESEKQGGSPANRAAINRFKDCLDYCELADLGAKGPPFTWQRGELLERLDRVVANPLWRSIFSSASVTNLTLPPSDHCGLWLRMNLSNQASP
ncbi:uncharacterized protein LOC130744196 [Lotus japonicus]|uniref:uncharacterized protein LOC130744196 n=1 Tax=Lotus japonicus TaxID=34305 RepID=UPI00258CF406|nr:uncharacterized protein LOC130744196 [Lotus japonicus]